MKATKTPLGDEHGVDATGAVRRSRSHDSTRWIAGRETPVVGAAGPSGNFRRLVAVGANGGTDLTGSPRCGLAPRRHRPSG